MTASRAREGVPRGPVDRVLDSVYRATSAAGSTGGRPWHRVLTVVVGLGGFLILSAGYVEMQSWAAVTCAPEDVLICEGERLAWAAIAGAGLLLLVLAEIDRQRGRV